MHTLRAHFRLSTALFSVLKVRQNKRVFFKKFQIFLCLPKMDFNAGFLFIFKILLKSFIYVLFDASMFLSLSTFHNFALVQDPFRVLVNIDWLLCLQSCSKEKKCVSYNFKILSSEMKLCELHEHGIHLENFGRTSLLVYFPGSVYHQVLKKPTFKVCINLKDLLFVTIFLKSYF